MSNHLRYKKSGQPLGHRTRSSDRSSKSIKMELIDSAPSFRGIPLKYIALVTLTVQNSALILIMHYSRVMPGFQKKRYFASTAVLMNELVKLIICFILNLRDQRRNMGQEFTWLRAYHATFTRDAWKLTIPAALYTVCLRPERYADDVLTPPLASEQSTICRSVQSRCSHLSGDISAQNHHDSDILSHDT